MDKSILHVLNGGGTASSFKFTGLPGDTLVWNELMCSGPVCTHSKGSSLHKIRQPFMETYFDSKLGQYQQLVLAEWEKSDLLPQYNEVVLWFEFDLFCQANLLFWSHWLHLHAPADLKITLVSPGSHPEIEDFRGMGQLNPGQLADLFPGRVPLFSSDLRFGAEVWEAWIAGDLFLLQSLAKKSSTGWPHLKQALKAHFRRLPDVSHGLNAIELRLLRCLQSGPQSRSDLFRDHLAGMPELGFGDLQFFKLLDGLCPVLLTEDAKHCRLSPLGAAVLEGRRSRLDIAPVAYWVGTWKVHGVKFPYRWDAENEKIISLAD